MTTRRTNKNCHQHCIDVMAADRMRGFNCGYASTVVPAEGLISVIEYSINFYNFGQQRLSADGILIPPQTPMRDRYLPFLRHATIHE